MIFRMMTVFVFLFLSIVSSATELQAASGATAADVGPAQSAREETAGSPENGRAVRSPGLTFQPASVVVLNREVAVFRTQLYGYIPQDRAEIVQERIHKQIEKRMFGPITKKVDRTGTLIMNNGEIAFTIAHGDLDILSGQTMEEASDDAVQTLSLALQEAREVRSTPILLKALARLVIATVLFAAILLAVRRLYRWLIGKLKVVLRPRLERVAIGASIYLTDVVMGALKFLVGLAAWAAAVLAADLWLTYWLHLFPYTRPWGETLRQHVFGGLGTFGLAVIGTVPSLIVIVFIFLVTRVLTQIVKRFFYAIETGQLKVSESFAETARPTNRIIVAVLWLFAVVAAYPYIPGSGTDAFKGVSLFVGLLISLGSSSIVGQVASGLILMYSRSLKPGEYVRVGETEGTVLSLGMLSTKIRTVKNEEVSIPNGVMIGTATKNYSRLARTEKVIIYTSVTIGYDTPWRQVNAMLQHAADRTEGLRKDPKPFVLQNALADFYVEYQLNAYIKKPEDRIPVLADLHANIQDVFNEFGVQIMSPHYFTDPPQAKIVSKERWYQAPAKREQTDEAV